MRTYEKIETVFARDMEGTKKLIFGKYRNDTVEFLRDVPWIWTEKIDGCLRSGTKILCADGTERPIKEIVENRMSIDVYGFDGQRIVPTRVIGWHYNGETEEWYKIKINRRGLGTKGNTYKLVTCTGNHKFYVGGEYKRADELCVGEKVMTMRTGQTLSYQQEQIVTGLLIGDGSIADAYKSVEFSHKEAHEEYVDWLLASLGSIAGNKQKVRISGYGSAIVPARTISCSQVESISRDHIKDGKRVIPANVKLGPISMAILYMDDGSLSHSPNQIDRCTISLNDYDEESVDNLVSAIQTQMHMKPIKYYSKGWNLRFNIDDSNVLQTVIAPYVCECMQYKLAESFRGRFAGVIPNGISAECNECVELEIMDIEKCQENHKRYDLTTETHNYFANGVLVHNCNVRILWDGHYVSCGGRTDRASLPAPLVNKLNEYFAGEQTAQLFEQMFGDREVILFGEGYGDKIQAVGKNYIPGGVDFIVFDVLIGNYYQPRDNVEGIAKAFGLRTVPVVGIGTLEQAIEYVKGEPMSVVAQQPVAMEGIVCRPALELHDRCGNRLIVKIKRNDIVEV